MALRNYISRLPSLFNRVRISVVAKLAEIRGPRSKRDASFMPLSGARRGSFTSPTEVRESGCPYSLPGYRDLETLPRWALVALAVRCAKRASHALEYEFQDVEPGRLISPRHHEQFSNLARQAIQLADMSAASAIRLPDPGMLNSRTADAGVIHWQEGAPQTFRWACYCAATAQNMSSLVVSKKHLCLNAQSAFRLSLSTVKGERARSQVAQGMWRDFAKAKFVCRKWDFNENTPASQALFEQIETAHASDIRHDVHLLSRVLRRAPSVESLRDGPAASLEEFASEYLQGLGYLAEMTPQTRDGGLDVRVGIPWCPQQQIIVECKRYAERKTVGVQAIRSLHGVRQNCGADLAILITTSRVTAPGRRYARENGLEIWDAEELASRIEEIRRVLGYHYSRSDIAPEW